MWINVRLSDGSKSARIDGLSKQSKVEELRLVVEKKFNVSPNFQRLIYGGKQLEDGHSLFEYDVRLNDTIQLYIRPEELKKESPKKPSKSFTSPNPLLASAALNGEQSSKENKLSTPATSSKESRLSTKSHYYMTGDLIDAKDKNLGAWFEAKVVGIYEPPKSSDEENSSSILNAAQTSKKVSPIKAPSLSEDLEDFLQYQVKFERDEEEEEDAPMMLSIKEIRPRARTIVPFDKVVIGQTYMVNYNVHEPKERGFWYDCKVSGIKNRTREKRIFGTIQIGFEFDDCEIRFIDEIFNVEKVISIKGRDFNQQKLLTIGSPVKRKVKPDCDHCNDAPSIKCRHCSCYICGGKDQPEKQILCDECNMAYHLWCLDPPMEGVPDDEDWYCPDCKNDSSSVIHAGEKLRENKRKLKMASSNATGTRDWGKGMACLGRTKVCTIVPDNHFGPVPGVEVGMMWKYRLQVSEVGIHRPHVAGIHGRESEGAFSIVLSGGYEDDVDKGDEFTYTGSGGRDLSGNKRTAEQSSDQKLTRMNKALALNCNAPIKETGSESKDWKLGKPVRVVRNWKGSKYSEFSPKDGMRYDGLYKVVKYWPETGKSGFLVWRYLLRRDDPIPAPWTTEGIARIQDFGFKIEYPEGYIESAKGLREIPSSLKGKETPNVRNKRKVKNEGLEDSINLNMTKRSKVKYELPNIIKSFIKEDVSNEKSWSVCEEACNEGRLLFLKKVEELFTCVCCQELVAWPVTSPCSHNICQPCLKRSFKAEIFSCPVCRNDLGKDFSMDINKYLQEVLKLLFKGYDVNRK